MTRGRQLRCPRCLHRKRREELRHFDPSEGKWIELEACKTCLSKGRTAV